MDVFLLKRVFSKAFIQITSRSVYSSVCEGDYIVQSPVNSALSVFPPPIELFLIFSFKFFSCFCSRPKEERDLLLPSEREVIFPGAFSWGQYQQGWKPDSLFGSYVKLISKTKHKRRGWQQSK